jgi:carbamoyl-phosphate synthase small subunit
VAFGAKVNVENPVIGEVVFNTSLYGYQEILTDPSYAGQIMTFTYPHIGNYGCNSQDIESDAVHVRGVIIRNESKVVSNYRAEESLHSYLKSAGVMGLAGIDTRKLVKHIRDNGAQMGAMACGDNLSIESLKVAATAAGSMLGKDYVTSVTCKEAYSWTEYPWDIDTNSYKSVSNSSLVSRPHVVAMDFGIKKNILRLLVNVGFRVTVVPAHTSADKVLEYAPDAIFLSNGPGDPAVHGGIVEEVKKVLGKLPIFGICLGHQILAQAVGAKTFKLKFGHRGGNHPVLEYSTEVIEITSQNHGFAVASEGIDDSVELTHINLNDNTVEGISIPGKKAFSVQYHPEASPGPHDSSYLFERFFQTVVGYK